MNEVTESKRTGFDLSPQNLNEAKGLADMFASTELVPKDYRNKPNECLVAMMLGNEIGLNPMQALQNIAVINGRPSIWGDAMLALVQNHPLYEWHKEEFDEATMTATFTIKRKGSPVSHIESFSMADAQTAGLSGSQTYKKYPKRMLQMRARGFGLRNQFSDALCGLISAEEATDYQHVEKGEPVQVNEAEVIEEKPIYSEADFEKNFPKWKAAIEAKKHTAESLMAMIETKGDLTEDQKTQLKGVQRPATETGDK